jgi:hypothetical protein
LDGSLLSYHAGVRGLPMVQNSQDRVEEQRAAVLLGLPTAELRTYRLPPAWVTSNLVTAASRWFLRRMSCGGSACWPRSPQNNGQAIKNLDGLSSLTPPRPWVSPYQQTRGLSSYPRNDIPPPWLSCPADCVRRLSDEASVPPRDASRPEFHPEK